MALPPLNQDLLPHLTIGSDCLPNSDGVLARYVERQGAGGAVQKVAIGYFKDQNWMNWSWAFAPFANGDVPTMKGSELDSWMTTMIKGSSLWTRDHQYADYKKSGDDGKYLCSTDENGKKFALVPANGQNGFVGYVPARFVDESLKNGYLTNPQAFRLIADSKQVLHLACRGIPYTDHGFTLQGKVWWPVKNPPLADCAQAIGEAVAKIEIKVRQWLLPEQIPMALQPLIPLAPTPLRLPTQENVDLYNVIADEDESALTEAPQLDDVPKLQAPPLNTPILQPDFDADDDDGVLVDYVHRVNNLEELTPMERARAETIINENIEIINERDDLGQNQKEEMIRLLTERINRLAMRRHFHNEPTAVMIRVINPPPESNPNSKRIVGFATAMGTAQLLSVFPIPTMAAGGVVIASEQFFDDTCFINKIIRWITR